MEKLLIVDDNEDIRTQLKWGMGKDYDTFLARDRKEALALFKKEKPTVVTLDLGLPPDEEGTAEGFLCLEEMLKQISTTKIIVVTGNDDKASALKAVQMGAYDFYRKPINLEELCVILRRAFHLASIEQENRSLHTALEHRSPELAGMVAQCEEMMEVFSTIRKVASTDAPVLIEGESGTGKELVARAIHALSLRNTGPFVAINCAAIPENLLESELFGHEKGSFTGALAQLQGKFEYAHKGTLFLDEIGELPPALQVKLLRFLQDKTIQRVGGREDIVVDTRILCATNRNIAEEIKNGGFREDLFYRIGVVLLKLPPLRERKGDILLLATLFLRKYGEEYKKKLKGFTSAAVELMDSYSWPGNIRELENKIQRAVILSEGPMVEPRDLGFDSRVSEIPELSPLTTLKEAKDKLERSMVLNAIERHEGNVSKAAEQLGISRPTYYDIMKKYGLHPHAGSLK